MKYRQSLVPIIALSVCLSGFLADEASARVGKSNNQNHSGNRYGKNGPSNKKNNKNGSEDRSRERAAAQSSLSNASNSENTAARELALAVAAYSTASTNAAVILNRLRHEFETGPKSQARDQYHQSQTRRNELDEAILKKVRDQPDYIAAAAEEKSARERVEAMQSNGVTTNPQEMAAAAKDLIAANSKISKIIEAEAAKSPELIAAREETSYAAKRAGELDRDFKQTIRNNSEYMAANEAWRQAEAVKLAAEGKYLEAEARKVQAIRAVDRANAPQNDQARKNGHSGHGRGRGHGGGGKGHGKHK